MFISLFCFVITLLSGSVYAAENSTNQTRDIIEKVNQTMDPYLIYSLNQRLSDLDKNQSDTSYISGNGSLSDPNRVGSSYPTSTSFPCTGNPKMLVILVDFPDYPHNATQTVTEMRSLYFGDGSEVTDSTQNLFPYESLHSWYLRSSYGALNITGDVLGWYRAKYNRDYYSGKSETLIMEALRFYDNTTNFAQYDNNHDGIIEGLAIKWTGPRGDWSSDWWPYMTSWYEHPFFTVDQVTIGSYTWEDYSPRIKTDIHETGHLLGLPDLYDYDTQVDPYENVNGPGWGVGGLDMMDEANCDFNCFFKLLFGWISPYYVNNTNVADQLLTLNAMESNSTHGCVVIYPGRYTTKGKEFYMVEYRTKTGNDEKIPQSGLYIWHIDAILGNDGQFYYDNTGSVHNFIDLVQADGLFDIQNGSHQADAGDVYVRPDYFGPATLPNSNWYNGSSSGIYVYGLSYPYLPSKNTISAFFGWQGPKNIIDIGSAVENQILNWSTGGNNNWTGSVSIGKNDTDSAQSGDLEGAGSTWMSTMVNGPGYLNFEWKVSSEMGYDFLRFLIDGVEQNKISGEQGWQNLSFILVYGSHNLTWIYNKNNAVFSGYDCGWVDNVQWTPDNTPPTINNTNPLNNTKINDVRKTLSLTFSEDVVVGGGFDGISVVGPSGVVLVSKGVVGSVLTLVPSVDFMDGFYTVNIPANAIYDRVGNSLENSLAFNFIIDSTSPTINAITPLNNSENPTDNIIKITFSEDVVVGGGFDGISVVGPSGVVLVSKGVVGSVLTLVPSAGLVDGFYTVNIPSNALKDLAGNNIASFFSSSFKINKTVPNVWANVNSGLYRTNLVVSLNMNEAGDIYYTINGSTPTNSSLKYSGPITISSTTTLKFFAVDKVFNPSPIFSATYNIDKTAPKVISTYPKSLAIRVSRTANLYFKFSENIKTGINWSKIVVKNRYGKVVGITKWISGNVFYIKTNTKRSAYSYYTIYVPAGAVSDRAGNGLASGYTIKFKTGGY